MLEEMTKSRLRLLVFLEFQERDRFVPDGTLIKSMVLLEGDPLDVDPILGPACERLEDDEICGAAGQQRDVFGHEEGRVPTHGLLLEWHGPQGHGEGDPVPTKQQEDAMSKREAANIGDAGRKDRQEQVCVFGLPSKPADDRDVEALRQAGFTPALERQATDETEAKSPGAGER